MMSNPQDLYQEDRLLQHIVLPKTRWCPHVDYDVQT